MNWIDRVVHFLKYICYCNFGHFSKNFIFVNSIIRHIRDFKTLRQGHDLPTSVKDRVISPFRRFFI